MVDHGVHPLGEMRTHSDMLWYYLLIRRLGVVMVLNEEGWAGTVLGGGKHRDPRSFAGVAAALNRRMDGSRGVARVLSKMEL